jgi:hypothetical protein
MEIDPFPESRSGSLDAPDLLKHMGLTKERMQAGDSLFFYQLQLPMCDPKKSGIDSDPQKDFYSKIDKFSNLYAVEIGMGDAYSHKFELISPQDLVRWTGVVVCDGVKGGSDGALYQRWMEGASYDETIDESMNHSRWLQIKRCIKLNDNRSSPLKGEEGYNPADKFDLLYDVCISNLNELTKKAELDVCADETTWAHNAWGPKDTGLVSRVLGKPGVCKGGQIVIVSDVHRCRPRAYVHRHKLHKRPKGFTMEGPNEVRMIVEKIRPLIAGEVAEEGRRQIFSEKPHSTWDNYFSGDNTMAHMGENGFPITFARPNEN